MEGRQRNAEGQRGCIEGLQRVVWEYAEGHVEMFAYHLLPLATIN